MRLESWWKVSVEHLPHFRAILSTSRTFKERKPYFLRKRKPQMHWNIIFLKWMNRNIRFQNEGNWKKKAWKYFNQSEFSYMRSHIKYFCTKPIIHHTKFPCINSALLSGHDSARIFAPSIFVINDSHSSMKYCVKFKNNKLHSFQQRTLMD